MQDDTQGQSSQPNGEQLSDDTCHLSLDQVLTADHLTAIQSAGRLIFQTTGDTGGTEFLQSLHIVAEKMAEDCQLPKEVLC